MRADSLLGIRLALVIRCNHLGSRIRQGLRGVLQRNLQDLVNPFNRFNLQVLLNIFRNFFKEFVRKMQISNKI